MTVRHIVAVGGSDAGISAALRARELDPTTDVTVIVADAYPNFSICGIPYYISGEVTHWSNLAHRTAADLAATGMRVLTDTRATRINVNEHTLDVLDATGAPEQLAYDALIVSTGAISAHPPIDGLDGPDALGPTDGVHLLHSMGDTFAVMDSLQQRDPATAVIVGAGYIGLEMAEALTTRGIHVTQVEALPEVLPTVDPELGALVHAELVRHGVDVLTNTAVTAHHPHRQAARSTRTASQDDQRSRAQSTSSSSSSGSARHRTARRPAPTSASQAPSSSTSRWRTNLPDVWAAGDCVHHPPPAPRHHLPAARHHRSQARPGRRGERARRPRAASPAASAPRSSRSSTSSPPAPVCANTKPLAAGFTARHQPIAAPTTTRPTTRAPHPIAIRITGDARHRPTPRRPARRAPRRRDLQARRHLRHRPVPRDDRRRPSASSTCPTRRRSAHRGTPSRWPPRPGSANTSHGPTPNRLTHMRRVIAYDTPASGRASALSDSNENPYASLRRTTVRFFMGNRHYPFRRLPDNRSAAHSHFGAITWCQGNSRR